MESPTGTGKTLCILSTCLSILHKNEKNINKVIFLSRTHNQLMQVNNELKSLPFKTKVITLGSRMIYCMKPNVKSFGNKIATAM